MRQPIHPHDAATRLAIIAIDSAVHISSAHSTASETST
jgi:hypothetical protein